MRLVIILGLTTAQHAWAQAEDQCPMVTGMLSLNEAIVTALRWSPILQGQNAEAEAARARLRQAMAETRPEMEKTWSPGRLS